MVGEVEAEGVEAAVVEVEGVVAEGEVEEVADLELEHQYQEVVVSKAQLLLVVPRVEGQNDPIIVNVGEDKHQLKEAGVCEQESNFRFIDVYR